MWRTCFVCSQKQKAEGIDLDISIDSQTPTTVAMDVNTSKSPAKSKSSKKPRRRETKESKVKIGLMEGHDLPEWLPQGWQLERKKRENGVNTGMVEAFYYDPEKGQQFSEVLLFLESRTRRKRKSSQRRLFVPSFFYGTCKTHVP